MTAYANITVKFKNETVVEDFHGADGEPGQLGRNLATASFWKKNAEGNIEADDEAARVFLAAHAVKGSHPEAEYHYFIDLGSYSGSFYTEGNGKKHPLLKACLMQSDVNPVIPELLDGAVTEAKPSCIATASEPINNLVSDAEESPCENSELKSKLKWVSRYFKIAELVSTWSKDPSSKVGAIIVGDKGQIISQGYNGFPRGVADTPERYNTREIKYKLVVHAEMNAILNALYNGSSVVGAAIYIHNLPVCQECAKAIIQAGISEVFIDTRVNERWQEAWNFSKMMFSECGVKCYYFNESENTLIPV